MFGHNDNKISASAKLLLKFSDECKKSGSSGLKSIFDLPIPPIQRSNESKSASNSSRFTSDFFELEEPRKKSKNDTNKAFCLKKFKEDPRFKKIPSATREFILSCAKREQDLNNDLLQSMINFKKKSKLKHNPITKEYAEAILKQFSRKKLLAKMNNILSELSSNQFALASLFKACRNRDRIVPFSFFWSYFSDRLAPLVADNKEKAAHFFNVPAGSKMLYHYANKYEGAFSAKLMTLTDTNSIAAGSVKAEKEKFENKQPSNRNSFFSDKKRKAPDTKNDEEHRPNKKQKILP